MAENFNPHLNTSTESPDLYDCNGCLIKPDCNDGDMHEKLSKLSAAMEMFDGDLDLAMAYLEKQDQEMVEATPLLQEDPRATKPDSDFQLLEPEEYTPEQQAEIEKKLYEAQIQNEQAYQKRESVAEGLDLIIEAEFVEKNGQLDIHFGDGTTLLGTLDNDAAANGNGVDSNTMRGYLQTLKDEHHVHIPIIVDGEEVGVMYFWRSGNEVFAEALDMRQDEEPEEDNKVVEIPETFPEENSIEIDDVLEDIQEIEDAVIQPASPVPQTAEQQVFVQANIESFKTNGIAIIENPPASPAPASIAATPSPKGIDYRSIPLFKSLFEPAAPLMNREPPAETATLAPVVDIAEVTEQISEPTVEKAVENSTDKQIEEKSVEQPIAISIDNTFNTSSIYRETESTQTEQAPSIVHSSGGFQPKQVERTVSSAAPEQSVFLDTAPTPTSGPEDPQPGLKIDSSTGETIIESAPHIPKIVQTEPTPHTQTEKAFEPSNKEQPGLKIDSSTAESITEIAPHIPKIVQTEPTPHTQTEKIIAPSAKSEAIKSPESIIISNLTEKAFESPSKEHLEASKESLTSSLQEARNALKILSELRNAERTGPNPAGRAAASAASEDDKDLKTIPTRPYAAAPANLPTLEIAA